MNRPYRQTLEVLEHFLSPATARALLSRALKEHGATSSSLTHGDLIRMGSGLRKGMRLFVDAAKREAADRAIMAHCGGDVPLPDSVALNIKDEADISRVRSEARRLCTTCGAGAFSMQKIATIVSELARNIVLYAGEGELTITPQQKRSGLSTSAKTSVLICASDQGPGIPNLDHILSGSYQSKTGLGKGLLGTKRLAEEFDIATSARGTTITAEIAL